MRLTSASAQRRRDDQDRFRKLKLTNGLPSTIVDNMKLDLPTPMTPREGLAAVVALRRLADSLEYSQVERAAREGWSLARIAEALGVTRQAVHKKHAARLAAAGIKPGRKP